MNIIIRKIGKKIVFENAKQDRKKDQLNVTNVWNFKEIIFEEKKLQDSFIQVFLKELFMKENITSIHLEKVEMFPLVVPIIQDIPTIKDILIKEDAIVPSEYYSMIKKLIYLETLECYQMTSFLFENCLKDLKINIHYRKKEFIKSNFMILNDLNTHSKIVYKRKVTFYDTYNYEDLSDFAYFLKENKRLEKIEFYGTDTVIFTDLLQCILTKEKKNLQIVVLQRKEEQQNLEDIVNTIYKKYRKKLKQSNIDLTIKYTKEYKEKNVLKQLNLNIFRLSVLLLFFVTFSIYGISKFHAYSSQKEVEEIEKLREELKNSQENKIPIVVDKTEEEPKTEPEETPPKKEETPKKEENNTGYTKDMASLKKTNNEFTGWLTVNNTSISYPVVKHSDNDYYLKHGFNKKYNINGWIFMDYRNHIETFDQNTIIYGHDSNYSIMFGDLKKVLQKNWYTNKQNQIITYETAQKKYEAQIFSIYVINNTTDYLQVVFSDKEFEAFIKKLTDRSIYDFNTNVSVQDKIITLSTCYKDSSKRLVVHAKIK